MGSVYIDGKLRESDVDVLRRTKQPEACRDKIDTLANAKQPYKVTKITWGQACQTKILLKERDTLYSASRRGPWRVIISSDENLNYLSFIPSIAEHWKKHDLLVELAFVGHPKQNLLTELEKHVNVTVFDSVKVVDSVILSYLTFMVLFIFKSTADNGANRFGCDSRLGTGTWSLRS